MLGVEWEYCGTNGAGERFQEAIFGKISRILIEGMDGERVHWLRLCLEGRDSGEQIHLASEPPVNWRWERFRLFSMVRLKYI